MPQPPSGSGHWLDLLLDLIKKVDDNHNFIRSQLDQVKDLIDVRIEPIEEKLVKHEHYFNTINGLTALAFGGGGIVTIVSLAEYFTKTH